MANNPEDLAEVGRWLDTYPNLYVDIASRIGELGRQPRTARRFFEQYADRILLGTDGPWPETRLGLYWQFLETEDEYFPYSEKVFPLKDSGRSTDSACPMTSFARSTTRTRPESSPGSRNACRVQPAGDTIFAALRGNRAGRRHGG